LAARTESEADHLDLAGGSSFDRRLAVLRPRFACCADDAPVPVSPGSGGPEVQLIPGQSLGIQGAPLFAATLSVPYPPIIVQPTCDAHGRSCSRICGTEPLELEWTGGSGWVRVSMGVQSSPGDSTAYAVECFFDANAHHATIPASVVTQVVAGTTAYYKQRSNGNNEPMGPLAEPALPILIAGLASTVVHVRSYDILYQIELDMLEKTLPVDMP
jgi:hypothetical protein